MAAACSSSSARVKIVGPEPVSRGVPPARAHEREELVELRTQAACRRQQVVRRALPHSSSPQLGEHRGRGQPERRVHEHDGWTDAGSGSTRSPMPPTRAAATSAAKNGTSAPIVGELRQLARVRRAGDAASWRDRDARRRPHPTIRRRAPPRPGSASRAPGRRGRARPRGRRAGRARPGSRRRAAGPRRPRPPRAGRCSRAGAGADRPARAARARCRAGGSRRRAARRPAATG